MYKKDGGGKLKEIPLGEFVARSLLNFTDRKGFHRTRGKGAVNWFREVGCKRVSQPIFRPTSSLLYTVFE